MDGLVVVIHKKVPFYIGNPKAHFLIKVELFKTRTPGADLQLGVVALFGVVDCELQQLGCKAAVFKFGRSGDVFDLQGSRRGLLQHHDGDELVVAADLKGLACLQVFLDHVLAGVCPQEQLPVLGSHIPNAGNFKLFSRVLQMRSPI